ncbi:MATE family efflux transporter [uncultured Clostridium sp.]|uniref:MATE family efflux transporter n=1 Tax=uncultured Clostridium sp. TaxID=59620 RepID=UPI0028E2A196|nr:MATE family efflux transporter [uncultured Clostridium sp.]
MKKLISNELKELNNIAVPLIIQSVAGLIIGFTDQAMVGRISIFAYSAVGVIVSLISLLAGVLGFTSVVFNINGAKALGKDDNVDFQDEFSSCLMLNILIGLTFFIIIILFQKPILILLYGFKGRILEEAVAYSSIMSVYIIIQLLLFSFSALFKIKKMTKWILIGSTGASIINLILDYGLIFGNFGFPRLEVKGAAIATILSLIINLLFYICICRKYMKFNYKKIEIYKFKIKNNIKESIPLMGQEVLEGSVFIIATNAIISRIGVVEISAYLILTQLINIILIPMYMYGSATLTLISKNDGENNEESLINIPKLSILLSIIIYLFLSILFLAFRKYLPRLITNDEEVILIASNLLIHIIISNIFNPFCTVYKYSLQSLNESKFVLFNTAKVNFLSLFLMLFSVYILKIQLYGIFISLFINYLIVFVIYLKKYNSCIAKKFNTYNIENMKVN